MLLLFFAMGNLLFPRFWVPKKLEWFLKWLWLWYNLLKIWFQRVLNLMNKRIVMSYVVSLFLKFKKLFYKQSFDDVKNCDESCYNCADTFHSNTCSTLKHYHLLWYYCTQICDGEEIKRSIDDQFWKQEFNTKQEERRRRGTV